MRQVGFGFFRFELTLQLCSVTVFQVWCLCARLHVCLLGHSRRRLNVITANGPTWGRLTHLLVLFGGCLERIGEFVYIHMYI